MLYASNIHPGIGGTINKPEPISSGGKECYSGERIALRFSIIYQKKLGVSSALDAPFPRKEKDAQL